jgi:ribosome biogenesis protein NSA1
MPFDEDTNFNVYVGSENGILKAIYFGAGEETPKLKNFHIFGEDDATAEIVSLNWGFENNEKELIVGFSNNIVKTYSTKLRAYTQGSSLPISTEKHGQLVAAYNLESNFIFGTTKGSLLSWNYAQERSPTEISTGSHLAQLKRCDANINIYATGGKETELQLWDMETPHAPIFKAKNVPHDFLDLRIPVWVQDITFLREASDLVAISTRYGQVRLYDTRAGSRPIVDIQYVDHPLMAISTVSSNNRHVLVGSARGTLGLIDLRSTKGEQFLLRQYDGFVGGIRSISAHPTLPFFASCGLDRHVYLHHCNEKKQHKKLYLKSRLQRVIMSKTLECTGPNNSSRNISSDVIAVELGQQETMWAKPETDGHLESPQPLSKKKKLADK